MALSADLRQNYWNIAESMWPLHHLICCYASFMITFIFLEVVKIFPPCFDRHATKVPLFRWQVWQLKISYFLCEIFWSVTLVPSCYPSFVHCFKSTAWNFTFRWEGQRSHYVRIKHPYIITTNNCRFSLDFPWKTDYFIWMFSETHFNLFNLRG